MTNQTLKMSTMWTFTLNAQQTRLVLAALGGRLREDQREDARELGNHLTLLRATIADQYADEMNLHASKVEPCR
jgi:hypothetical protein